MRKLLLAIIFLAGCSQQHSSYLADEKSFAVNFTHITELSFQEAMILFCKDYYSVCKKAVLEFEKQEAELAGVQK